MLIDDIMIKHLRWYGSVQRMDLLNKFSPRLQKTEEREQNQEGVGERAFDCV